MFALCFFRFFHSFSQRFNQCGKRVFHRPNMWIWACAAYLSFSFYNKQQFNSIQLCVISFEAQSRKTKKKHKLQLQINIWQCQHNTSRRQARAPNKNTHTHTFVGERRKRKKNNTLYSIAILCCVHWIAAQEQPTVLKAFLCDSSNLNRFGWFRSSVFRSFVL